MAARRHNFLADLIVLLIWKLCHYTLLTNRKTKEKADLFSSSCLHFNGLDCGREVTDRSRCCCFDHANRITGRWSWGDGAVVRRWRRRRCWMRRCVECGWAVQTPAQKFLHNSALASGLRIAPRCRSWSHTAGCGRSMTVAAIGVRHPHLRILRFLIGLWLGRRFSILFADRIRSLQNYVRRYNGRHRFDWYRRRRLLFGIIIAQAGNLTSNNCRSFQ